MNGLVYFSKQFMPKWLSELALTRRPVRLMQRCLIVIMLQTLQLIMGFLLYCRDSYMISMRCSNYTNLYSFDTFEKIIFFFTGSGTSLKFFSIHKIESGNVESLCGKSDAHI